MYSAIFKLQTEGKRMNKQHKLNILDTRLEIDGLERPLTILQVTDLHLINTDAGDSEEIQALRRTYSEWAPYSNEILEDIGEYCQTEKPDAVVFTGDICGFPTRKNLNILKNFLEQKCPPYLFVFGNHERFFTLRDFTPEMQQHYTAMYSFTGQGEFGIQTMNLAGIRLIGIDNSKNQISFKQLNKLEKLFSDNLPCILFFHVPMYLPALLQPVMDAWKQPFMMGSPISAVPDMNKDLIPTASTKVFIKLLTTQPTPVQAMFAGHIHFFDRQDEFFPGKKQYVTPMATTPNGCGLVRRIQLVPHNGQSRK